MTLDARRIAIQGIGYGALFVALQGFAPAEVQAQPASGGMFPPTQATKPAAKSAREVFEEQLAAIEAARQKKLAEAAAREAMPGISAFVPIAEPNPQSAEGAQEATPTSGGQAEARDAALPNVAEQPTAVRQAAVEANRIAAELETERAAADKKRSNRNRIAVLMALLLADQ